MDVLLEILTKVYSIGISLLILLFLLSKVGIMGFLTKLIPTLDNIMNINHSMDLFKRKYAKEDAINEMTEMLDFYVKAFQKDYLKNLSEDELKTRQQKNIQTTIKYGSNKTISLYSFYQQKLFNNELIGNAEIFALYSALIARLKYDVTGEWANPINILKVNVTGFKKVEDSISKELKKLKKYYM